ncbi:MAG TPA: glycoside hydrolase family 2 TIM barrel-domain containing protein, partial [Candidatus Bathyarchaeia archaeon]|nr:glycoside hydrolase family 2 TIM barrel-domain containing protein [Candidatus Bathyarchaeia archaeon]
MIIHKNNILIAAVVLSLFGSSCAGTEAQRPKGNQVRVIGEQGKWQLLVNDQPFVLKGVGVGRAKSRDGKVDFLAMAKDLGANMVRTWGIDQGDQFYLDQAHRYGLYVDAGIWLQPAIPGYKESISYVSDKKYRAKAQREALDYVRRYRDHPAVLIWNVGNEVIYWTPDENERVAFCQFLEKLIQEIHQIDPEHPVMYTTAWTTAVPYIKKYVPSLDILGLNLYGGIELAHQEVVAQLDLPYIVTEYGPVGPWDVLKDSLGQSLEPSDESKTYYYKQATQTITRLNGYCLGGFAFYLGDTNQVSSTWWNMNHLGYRKMAFWAMKEMYTGEKPPAAFPAIRDLRLSPAHGLKPGQEFSMTVQLREPIPVSTRFEYFASTAREIYGLEEYPNTEIPLIIQGQGPQVTALAPQAPGLYRVYAVAVDENGNAST